MPTLMETIKASNVTKTLKLSRCKPAKSMNISASIEKISTNFHLVSAKLSRIPMLFASGCREDGPVVVDKNFLRIGRLDCDYVPKVVVISGKRTFMAAKSDRAAKIKIWAGDMAIKPLKITAADSVSNSDIENKLRELILSTYKKKSSTKSTDECSYDAYPYLRDVYQGDNYCIFQLGKATFRQNYKIDPVTRNITLVGNKIQVIQTYTTAPTGDVSSSVSAASIGRSTDSLNYAPNAPSTDVGWQHDNPNEGVGGGLGSFRGPSMSEFTVDITTFGARNSEANNPQYKTMLNIEEALAQYLALIKNGMHKPVSMAGLTTPPAYINAARETKIAIKARKDVPSTFSTMDFLKWQDKRLSMKASAQSKLVNGEILIAADFAYVSDARDISTWHLPIASAKHIKNSLAAMSTASAIPKFERELVQDTVRRAARHFGILKGANMGTVDPQAMPNTTPSNNMAPMTAKKKKKIANKKLKAKKQK